MSEVSFQPESNEARWRRALAVCERMRDLAGLFSPQDLAAGVELLTPAERAALAAALVPDPAPG